jgi:hypothetical protein
MRGLWHRASWPVGRRVWQLNMLRQSILAALCNVLNLCLPATFFLAAGVI